MLKAKVRKAAVASVCAWIFLFIFNYSIAHAKEVLLFEDKDLGSIYLLNVNKPVDKECLLENINFIVSCVDAGQIEPYRVIIWKEHSIVQGALKHKTARIVRRDASKRNILISLESKDSSTILYRQDGQKEFYKMVNIIPKDQKVDITKCIRD